MTNLIPGAYREVSVADVDVALEPGALSALLLGRESYRRTRWIVVRDPSGHVALVEIGRADPEPLFSPICAVEVLAGPEESRYVVRPEIDTAVPSQLAHACDEPDSSAKRCVIVEGRYSHVSFVLDPSPLRVRVREVVPPRPAKLLEQAQRVLDLAEDLPPILLNAETMAVSELIPSEGPLLLQCRSAGDVFAGRDSAFLDQRPQLRDWTLVGCARSSEIHRWFYGTRPRRTVDTCPRNFESNGDGPLLTKCCLLESGVHVEPGLAVVPWGATLSQIREALSALASEAEPAWAPV
jgi:hypothetical protein